VGTNAGGTPRIDQVLRALFVFCLLMTLRVVARFFYRFHVRWIGEVPAKPWADLRLIAVMNHTSLYEVLWAGAVPPRLLWQQARHGVLPVAEKTARRFGVGIFFRLLARKVLVVTRQPDMTWQAMLDAVSPRSLVVIAPEGRMKRANGLDSDGKPITVRGGIADILAGMEHGRMLIAYSGGLHHVQVPGELLPVPFRNLRMGFESVDIPTYKASLQGQGNGSFKAAVIEDLTWRRDAYCTNDPVEFAKVPEASPGSPKSSQAG
jgi:1-acyl-sn-glycerol-3-phosphate acyltransferase